MKICSSWPWETNSMRSSALFLLLLACSLHHHTEACWWHLAQLTGRASTPALLGTPVAGGGPPTQPAGLRGLSAGGFPDLEMGFSDAHLVFLKIPAIPHCLAVK